MRRLKGKPLSWDPLQTEHLLDAPRPGASSVRVPLGGLFFYIHEATAQPVRALVSQQEGEAMVDQIDTIRSEGGDSSSTQQIVGQAQEKAQELGEQAKERAQEVKTQARGVVRSQVDEKSTFAGSQVRSTAEDLRSVGQELKSQGKETPAKLADQVADKAESLGRYLEDSDADRILHDVEDFARRQPWVVMAGGLALGFLASRFLKASSVNRYGANTSTRSRAQLRSSVESSGYSTSGPGIQTGISNYGNSGVE
jgi:hypothetical protein